MPATKIAAFQRLALMTDDEAVRLAKKLASATNADQMTTALDADLRAALEAQFGADAEKASEAEVARAALVFAADANPAQVLAVADAAEAQGALLTVAVITAALVILQTEVKVEKKNDKWSVKVHKPKASESLLKGFVKSILGLF